MSDNDNDQGYAAREYDDDDNSENDDNAITIMTNMLALTIRIAVRMTDKMIKLGKQWDAYFSGEEEFIYQSLNDAILMKKGATGRSFIRIVDDQAVMKSCYDKFCKSINLINFKHLFTY